MKKIFSLILVLTLAVGLLAGCGDSVVTQEEALEIVADDLGVDVSELTNAHVHVAEGENDGVTVPGFSIYVTVNDHHYSYLIKAEGGDILSSQEVSSSHSH